MSSFDFSDEKIPEESKSLSLKKEKPDFDFGLYEEPEEKEKSYLDTAKSYGKTAVKGFVEGVSSLGKVLGPLQERKRGEFSPEKQTETLNELLPTEDSFGEKGLRKGLNIAPVAIANPFGGPLQSAVRSGIGGYLSEGVKEVGGGETAQTFAELSAFMGPDVLKKLVEKGKYKPLISAARRFGMSDEQITPLIQSEFKKNWFSKIAKKTGKTEASLSKTKSALDTSYKDLINSPGAENFLDAKKTNELLDELSKIAGDLPAEVKNRISEDMMDLVKNPISGKSLINLWKDINYYLGKGEKQLGLFKEPIRKAIGNISPELEKDFGLVNDLYKKFYPMAKNLKPGNVDKFVDAVENLGLLGSIFTWNFPAMGTFIGEKTSRILAREMLINPKFQQLTKKMMIATQENRTILMKKTAEEMQKLINPFLIKESPQKENDESNGDAKYK